MGTSSDYTGGTGGNWTPYKHAASNFARHGGDRRAEKVLARYVAALGGAAAAAAAARAGGVGTGQAVAGFGAGVARDGLTPTLQQLGLGHLVGADRYDVLDGLVEALGGDGGTLEDQAVERAIIEAFRELYPDDAQTYEELESVKMDQAALVRFIEHFIAAWAYARLLPTLAEKFSHIEDRDTAQQRYDELRERMTKLVRLEISDRDPLKIAWRDAEGEAILNQVIDQLYEDMGDLE
jgi:tetratricopeptide (TPR) repeat protein